jgi:hypothetical protein
MQTNGRAEIDAVATKESAWASASMGTMLSWRIRSPRHRRPDCKRSMPGRANAVARHASGAAITSTALGIPGM